MNVNEKLQREDGTGPADGKLYRSIVGGLNYLTHTRPDIAFPVSVVSRYMHNPTKQHFGAAKRILRYVASSLNFGIWYTTVPEENFRLVGFTDSDLAGCLDDRKSTSGNIFSLGSGAITWSSKKQETIALSSSEAEYAAASSASRQALWLLKLLADFYVQQNGATVIYCDNQSAIAMAKNPAFHGRTKHIDIQHHFISKLVADGKIALKFCGTNEQIADVFTKSLPQAKLQFFMSELGVSDFESRGGVETNSKLS
ncbi:secreted RxLR effector protein 161-like [Silene latifolia]|uniref:secreted RxLR effector protein 161-like n=1 Tax=Silene latifolia TaxID=37657 RepID=UPI003D781BCC